MADVARLEEILRELEFAHEGMAHNATSAVRLHRHETDFMHFAQEAQLFMFDLLKNDRSRQRLRVVVGADCMRAARLANVLESAHFSGMCSNDTRLPEAKQTLKSVLEVLQDLGLGDFLKNALETDAKTKGWRRARRTATGMVKLRRASEGFPVSLDVSHELMAEQITTSVSCSGTPKQCPETNEFHLDSVGQVFTVAHHNVMPESSLHHAVIRQIMRVPTGSALERVSGCSLSQSLPPSCMEPQHVASDPCYDTFGIVDRQGDGDDSPSSVATSSMDTVKRVSDTSLPTVRLGDEETPPPSELSLGEEISQVSPVDFSEEPLTTKPAGDGRLHTGVPAPSCEQGDEETPPPSELSPDKEISQVPPVGFSEEPLFTTRRPGLLQCQVRTSAVTCLAGDEEAPPSSDLPPVETTEQVPPDSSSEKPPLTTPPGDEEGTKRLRRSADEEVPPPADTMEEVPSVNWGEEPPLTTPQGDAEAPPSSEDSSSTTPPGDEEGTKRLRRSADEEVPPPADTMEQVPPVNCGEERPLTTPQGEYVTSPTNRVSCTDAVEQIPHVNFPDELPVEIAPSGDDAPTAHSLATAQLFVDSMKRIPLIGVTEPVLSVTPALGNEQGPPSAEHPLACSRLLPFVDSTEAILAVPVSQELLVTEPGCLPDDERPPSVTEHSGEQLVVSGNLGSGDARLNAPLEEQVLPISEHCPGLLLSDEHPSLTESSADQCVVGGNLGSENARLSGPFPENVRLMSEHSQGFSPNAEHLALSTEISEQQSVISGNLGHVGATLSEIPLYGVILPIAENSEGQTPLVTLDLPEDSGVAVDSIERSSHAKDAAKVTSRNRPRLASSGRPGSKVNPPLDKLGFPNGSKMVPVRHGRASPRGPRPCAGGTPAAQTHTTMSPIRSLSRARSQPEFPRRTGSPVSSIVSPSSPMGSVAAPLRVRSMVVPPLHRGGGSPVSSIVTPSSPLGSSAAPSRVRTMVVPPAHRGGGVGVHCACTSLTVPVRPLVTPPLGSTRGARSPNNSRLMLGTPNRRPAPRQAVPRQTSPPQPAPRLAEPSTTTVVPICRTTAMAPPLPVEAVPTRTMSVPRAPLTRLCSGVPDRMRSAQSPSPLEPVEVTARGIGLRDRILFGPSPRPVQARPQDVLTPLGSARSQSPMIGVCLPVEAVTLVGRMHSAQSPRRVEVHPPVGSVGLRETGHWEHQQTQVAGQVAVPPGSLWWHEGSAAVPEGFHVKVVKTLSGAEAAQLKQGVLPSVGVVTTQDEWRWVHEGFEAVRTCSI